VENALLKKVRKAEEDQYDFSFADIGKMQTGTTRSQKGQKAGHIPQYQRYLKPQTLYCTPLILRYKHLRPQTIGWTCKMNT